MKYHPTLIFCHFSPQAEKSFPQDPSGMCTKAEKYKYFSQNLILKWKWEDLHKRWANRLCCLMVLFRESCSGELFRIFGKCGVCIKCFVHWEIIWCPSLRGWLAAVVTHLRAGFSTTQLWGFNSGMFFCDLMLLPRCKLRHKRQGKGNL